MTDPDLDLDGLEQLAICSLNEQAGWFVEKDLETLVDKADEAFIVAFPPNLAVRLIERLRAAEAALDSKYQFLVPEHLNHMTDGSWHDSCGYCIHRRMYSGTGITALDDAYKRARAAEARVGCCIHNNRCPEEASRD